MLPFLKKKEASASSPIESVQRKSDSEPEDYGTLDAICDDLCEALSVPPEKHSLVKAAITSLVDHIKEQDVIQDEQE